MKTLKLALVALMTIGLTYGTVNAQDATGKTTKKTEKKSTGGTTTNASGQHLKKDGTPDMRYKENKQAAGATKSTPAKTETKSTKASSTPSTSSKSTGKSGGAKGKPSTGGTTGK